MSGVQPVDPGLLRAHAAHIGVLRTLLTEIRDAGEPLGQSETAFGSTCGWMLTGLSDRYANHRDDIGYAEETLRLIADGLLRVANGDQQLKDLIRRDGDVATRDGTPVIEEPLHSLHGLMDSVISRVQDREWVEPLLAEGAPVAEFAAPVDPVRDALRTMGLHVATTRIDALRRLLEDFTGAPDTVAAHAALWQRIGDDLGGLSTLLHECVQNDLPRRDRLDVRSYQALMAYNVDGLLGRSEVATAMAIITRAAGDLLLLTRDIIRGIIGDLLATTTVWALDTGAVATRPAIAEQLGTIVAATWRIHAYMTALADSIITLSRIVDG